jgi:hypothetical protein
VLLRELVIRVTTAKKQEQSLFHDPAMLSQVLSMAVGEVVRWWRGGDVVERRDEARRE